MNHLSDTLIKIDESLAKDMTPVHHARFLAAEHHFKGKAWFWIWIPHLKWSYISDEHQKICLRTTNNRPIDLDGIRLDYMELKWIEHTQYNRPDFWRFNYQSTQGDNNE